MAERKKNVLITGGSRGIGAQAVRSFTAHGASCAFFYRNSYEHAITLSRETGALCVKCDVSDPGAVEGAMPAIRKFFAGSTDVLICNAGISDYGLVTDIGVERWRELMEMDLSSAYYTIKEVLPDMISEKRGSIIMVSSMWGQVGASCEVAYSTAKAGLIGLTKALAKEVGPSNIRVNCIAPGLIDTDMNGDVDDVTIEGIIEETPMGRMGTAQDVVNAMEFFATDRSGFITGQVLGVNGGLVV